MSLDWAQDIRRDFLAYYICRTDLAYVSPGIAHVGCLYPQWFEIHHVVKSPGRATIAEFWTLIKSIHRSICRPAACTFCSVRECTIKSQCRTPCTEPTVHSILPVIGPGDRPTISCEPGTVWPYQLTPGKSLSQKMKKEREKKKNIGE